MFRTVHGAEKDLLHQFIKAHVLQIQICLALYVGIKYIVDTRFFRCCLNQIGQIHVACKYVDGTDRSFIDYEIAVLVFGGIILHFFSAGIFLFGYFAVTFGQFHVIAFLN